MHVICECHARALLLSIRGILASYLICIRPFQVVLLFLVLDFSKDHAGGQYISIIATSISQSDSLGMLKYLCAISCMQYTSY